MAKNSIKEARKDKIIDAALKVFAEKGFSEANVADISKEAGVSTPVLYEYFKTKEEMLFAIPEKYTTTDLLDFMHYFKGPEQKIRAIVQGYLEVYEKNPLYTALVMLQLKTNRNFLKTKAYETIRKVARILLNAIQEGVNDGTFKENTDPFLIRSMILGAIEHLCIRKLLIGSPTNLIVYLDPMVDAILAGIRSQPKHLTVNLSLENIDSIKNLVSDAPGDALDGAGRKKKHKGHRGV